MATLREDISTFKVCWLGTDSDSYSSRAKTVVMYTDAYDNMGLGKTNWKMEIQVESSKNKFSTVGGTGRSGYVSQSSPSRRSISIGAMSTRHKTRWYRLRCIYYSAKTGKRLGTNYTTRFQIAGR